MRQFKKSTLVIALTMVLVLILGACAAQTPGDAETPTEGEAPAAVEDAGEQATESEAEAADEGEEKEPIRIGDTQWETLWINNAIAEFIITNGYDYPVEITQVTTPVAQQALQDGELDVLMELWYMNFMDWYTEVTESGVVLDLGDVFEKSTQGFYVPRYVIEGDEERGIEPMAPDLESVFDLPEYTELFQDPEDRDKGLIVNCITGWQCAVYNRTKLHAYGLADDYNTMEPGAAPALDAAIAGAYQKGDPIVSYYWEPTWLLGAYDMVQLEEPEWNEECEAEIQRVISGELEEDEVSDVAGCAYRTMGIPKVVNADLQERAPEIVEFLDAMFVGTDPLNKTAAFMSMQEASPEEAALWYFENYQEDWREWLPDDVEAKVEARLIEVGVEL